MENAIQLKPMSSLEKCFLDEDLASHKQRNRFIMFHNERLSYQIGMYVPPKKEHRAEHAAVRVKGPLAKFTKVSQVTSVGVSYPISSDSKDPSYLRTAPGLYPDPILPLCYKGEISLAAGLSQALWLDVELPDDFPAGNYTSELLLCDKNNNCVAKTEVFIRVLSACLPKQKVIHTEWFYSDCIAEEYRVRPFSKKHWSYLKSYIETAAKNGINMILTPVFTPELDTYVGGYRLTTQLVSITVTAPNQYTFDFSQLDRWIDLCLAAGIEYFEIPHFFTQWGSEHAPKFVARVNGRTKRIFGWETDALGEEYTTFLAHFIPALLAALKRKGVDKKCFFHVSDEPNLRHLEHYKRCSDLLKRHLGDDYPIIDALSNYDFYESGALKKPVPHISKIQPFLDHKIDGLWAYYCGQTDGFTGRNLAHPQSRTRILGVQLWTNHIEGFLHWGYNFYHTRQSYDYMNPFVDTAAMFFAPAGDAFLVYPGHDGKALESLRLNAMREAIDDVRALDLLTSLRGRDYAEALVRELAGGTLPSFFEFPDSADFLLDLRDRIATEIEGAE